MTASAPKNGTDRRPQRKRNAKANELPSFEFEQRGLVAGHQIIAGVDEAGRGPWAGPVVAAAVVLAPDQVPEGIADSKQLTENAREALFEEILKTAAVGLAFADPERIDRDNILAATLWSMQQAITELPEMPDLALIDGNRAPKLECAVETIVKGDARSLSIAAASIVAKVSRDRIMKRFDAQYPDYGFGQHKGYGTVQHSSALKKFGVTPLHRRSFKPIREALEAAAN
jgi:ribonuclease HII